ncbi:MAG: HepT-like ribonuclease domain-containing protein [Crocinitomicaceae bacterium]
MDERIQKWLYDIKVAIDEVDSFFEGESMIFENYQKNKMLKRAVEREFEIIGEAMNRILKRDESFIEKIEDAINIVGLRNQVIHAYDNISDESIWAIIINHLPRLKKDVNALLNE